MLKNLSKLYKDEKGSVFVEYALLIVGIVLAVAGSLLDLGSTTSSKIMEIENNLSSVGTQ